MNKDETTVVLFIDSLVTGGAQRQLTITAIGLKKLRLKVRVLIYRENFEMLALLKSENVPVDIIPRRRVVDFVFLIRFINYLRKYRVRVLITYLFYPNLVGRISKLFLRKVKVVNSFRNADIGANRFHLAIERLTWRLADRFISNSNSAMLQASKYIGVPNSLMSLIENGSDFSILKNNSPQDISKIKRFCDEFDRIILLPGRIAPQKNQLLLIKSLDIYRQKFGKYNIGVLFLGNSVDKKYRKEVDELAECLNLTSSVLIADPVVDITPVYQLADLIVLPSLWEGLPNVILEAMACRTLVAASNLSDHQSVIVHEKTGFHFDALKPDELSSLLDRVFSLTHDVELMILDGAFSEVKNRFGVERMVNQTYKLITELL